MLSWEQLLAKAFQRVRLDNVRRKILAFSLLATLIPSLTIGGIFYVHANRYLTDKVSDQLTDIASQNVRELDLWLKERLYEVRVFSSSYEVSENLDAITRAGSAPAAKTLALHRLTDYLKSVRSKFGDYEELAVVNAATQTIATSAARASALTFPSDWQARARADTPIMGQAYRDQELDRMVMLIAVPIRAQDRRLLGLLAVKLNFHSVEGLLDRSILAATGASYLVAGDGSVIAKSRRASSQGMDPKPLFAAGRESGADPGALEYRDAEGKPVIGVLKPLSQVDWSVVAQIGKDEVYAQTVRIRGLTASIGFGLILAIGCAAYILGLTIVAPLNRLTDGAAKVAAGDLGVTVPVVGGGEVRYLTEAFNKMVERLREDQEQLAAVNRALTGRNEELQTLSITDSLTGLHNRKHFMDVLVSEVARARRGRHPFCVAMIDVDHFKAHNDTSGHQVGDELLKTVGVILRESLRTMDYASRYGGDEFIILLPEVGIDEAVEVAERIRARVIAARVSAGSQSVSATVSIGLATFPDHGETSEAIIAGADGALYQAKRSGRDRVVVSDLGRRTDLRAAG